MLFDPNFVAAVAASNIWASYYALCHDYPLRLGAPKGSLAKTAILQAAAANLLPLERLGGPGAVYRLLSLPEGLNLNVIVQGNGLLETDFTVKWADTSQRGTFATLCHSASMFAEHQARQPAYPRPMCLSAEEVVTVIKRLDDFTRMLGKIARRT